MRSDRPLHEAVKVAGSDLGSGLAITRISLPQLSPPSWRGPQRVPEVREGAVRREVQLRLIKELLSKMDAGTTVDAGGLRRNPTAVYVDPLPCGDRMAGVFPVVPAGHRSLRRSSGGGVLRDRGRPRHQHSRDARLVGTVPGDGERLPASRFTSGRPRSGNRPALYLSVPRLDLHIQWFAQRSAEAGPLRRCRSLLLGSNSNSRPSRSTVCCGSTQIRRAASTSRRCSVRNSPTR